VHDPSGKIVSFSMFLDALVQCVRMIKFLDILGRYEASEFSQVEAVELLGVGERTFRR
jgi:hypothetical protein